MSGSVTGGKSAAETNRERHGDDFYSRIGRLGGAKGTGHTFAHGGISAADAGRIGGAISKRGVTLTPEEKAKKKAEIIAARKNHKYYFNRMG